MGARFEIGLSGIEKIADCSKLFKKMDELSVFLKLNNVWYNSLKEKSMRNRILIWSWELMSNNEVGALLDDINDEDYDAIENQVDEIVKCLEDVLIDFRKKTDIGLYLDYDCDNNCVFFLLDWDDIVQFTPKVKKLNDSNVGFFLVGS